MLDAATQAAGWKPRVAASNLADGERRHRPRVRLRHVRVDARSGVVADIEVNKKTGKIVVKHLYVAQNNGITINPELVANQMSGAAIQGLSRALYEQVDVHKERITSLDWVTYPILRFKDSPEGHARQRPPGQVHGRRPRAHGHSTCSAGNTAAFNPAGLWPARASRPRRPSARRSRTRSSTPRVCASARRR